MNETKRELDAWIGVHVMGMKAISIGETRPANAFVRDWIDVSHSLPHYSTDPAAAMKVLEKCATKCTVTVEYGATSKNKMQWMVARLSPHGDEYVEDFCKCDETLTMAICLFAKELFSTP